MIDTTQFLQLFSPQPANSYLVVATCEDEITGSLSKLLDGVDGTLRVILYNDENLDFSKPFRALPRSYDIVVLKDVLQSHKNQNMILKTSYTTLANAADIVIMEKKGVMDMDAVKQLLEDFEFRAMNDIDIVEGYDLIMAKKLHMWGNGL
ncbi:MAG: hypothetical protein U9N33_03035 [Campylobacterota bacterium]|nr:hypothetical protein [Campylobacterota bacterium]